MSSTASKNKLQDLGYETALLYANELKGEEFHPDYKKNKENFRALITTSVRLERKLKKYFKESLERIPKKIDWDYYFQKTQKFAVYEKQIDWNDEILFLQVAVEGQLDDIFGVGIQDAFEDVKIPSDFTVEDTEAIKFLKTYTLKLATDITNTTSARVKQSILRSITLGENQEEATKRLTKIINNPKRAAMIAHTETVRAYTEGKILTGERVGAQYKVWRDGQKSACPVCSQLNGQAIPLKSEFKLLSGGSVQGSPAHPNCRCLTKLLLNKDFLKEGEKIIEGEIIEDDTIQGKAGKGKKGKGGGASFVWITTKSGARIPIGVDHGFGLKVANIPGLGYKRANRLVSFEGAPDKGRVNAYKVLLKRGTPIAPVLLKKTKSGLWGIEDGKHRFEAMTKLGHKMIPVVTKLTPAYNKATLRDNRNIEKLIAENS